MTWLAGDRRGPAAAAEPLPPAALARVVAAGTTVAQNQTQAEAPGRQDSAIGEAPEGRTAEEIFLRGQRVLLAPGEATVDLGQFYGRSEDRLVDQVDSTFSLATVVKESDTGLLHGR